MVDDKTLQISSHVTEWRRNEEPKWQVSPVLFTMIQSEHVITWWRQVRKPFKTLHTFAEYKTENDRGAGLPLPPTVHLRTVEVT